MAIVFLGGGNMAAAIISGLRQRAYETNMVVSERNPERCAFLRRQYEVETPLHLPVLRADDVLILAVKPQDMQEACRDIELNGALVLSIAAGLNVETLSRYLGGSRRIVRVMPNTPAQIGLGVSGLFAAEGVSDDDRVRAQDIMQAAGMTVWLDNEAQMDAVTAVSGSGPAYVFYLMNALQQAAIAQGFDEQTAYRLSLATFKGAVLLAEHSAASFEVLQQQVTSKGGTTFAALEVFRQHQLAEKLGEGVQAACKRSQELSQTLV